MKTLTWVSRFLLGLVFVFSGFVKLVDPLGFAYKFGDYFTAFKLGFLDVFSLPLGMVLPAIELTLGLLLLLGYRRIVVSAATLGFMGFFTVLTLILALFNPVHDCGCFGDAIVLTNWQTFLKNILFLGPAVLVFLNSRKEGERGRVRREWSFALVLFLGSCLFSLWNLAHLPVLDFRAYDVGTLIEEEMTVPEGAPVDEYRTTLTYRNKETGKEEVFGMEDYPRDTSAWEFVTSDSRLMKKGYEPPIHDFAFQDAYGEDQVSRVLSDEGYSLLLIAYDLTHTRQEDIQKAAVWSGLELLADDFHFYALTASPGQEAEDFVSTRSLPFDFHAADEIMLKTVVRSNPGFVLIKNGVIVGKWAGRDFPELSEVDERLVEQTQKASAPLDEEALMLEDAGVFDDFSFQVLSIDQPAQKMLARSRSHASERDTTVILLLSLVLILLAGQLVSPLDV
ncbi:MAG: DoxX family protein [Bacteroidales bacterium]